LSLKSNTSIFNILSI